MTSGKCLPFIMMQSLTLFCMFYDFSQRCVMTDISGLIFRAPAPITMVIICIFPSKQNTEKYGSLIASSLSAKATITK